VLKDVNEIVNENTEKSDPEIATATSKVIMKKCFFCDAPIHARFRCLAKEANCHSCGIKRGSFLTYVTFKKEVTSSAFKGPLLSLLSLGLPLSAYVHLSSLPYS